MKGLGRHNFVLCALACSMHLKTLSPYSLLIFEKVTCKQPTIRRLDFVEQNPLGVRMSSEEKVDNRLHKARVFKSLLKFYNFTKVCYWDIEFVWLFPTINYRGNKYKSLRQVTGDATNELPPFSLIRDFGKQNTRGNISKISVSLACYWQIGSKSTNHSPIAWRREG